MKTGRFVSILLLVLAVLYVVGSCATKHMVISDEDFFELYSGTWVNPDYRWDTAKRVIKPDSTWEHYIDVDKQTYACYGHDTIMEKWTDSEGNIWYKALWECIPHQLKGYVYGKISESGNIHEYIWDFKEIHKWKPEQYPDSSYCIYYSQ
jgi:hypothetical protein